MEKLTTEEENFLLNLAKSNGLTDRENQIALYTALGASVKEIGEILFIADRTVLNHLQRIYTRVNVRNAQSALASWWLANSFDLKLLDKPLADKISKMKE